MAVHWALDGALAMAVSSVRSAKGTDPAYARRVGAFFDDVLSLVQLHHDGEDDLLCPLLAERARGSTSLLSTMQRQHDAVVERLASCRGVAEQYAKAASRRNAEALIVRKVCCLVTPFL